MRLFCLIPNHVFLEKIIGNNSKIGSLDFEDFVDTYHDDFSYDLPAILEYLDKEDWTDNSICCFTTPAEAKDYLNDDNVLISFEKDDKEFVKINADKYYDYLKTKINFEKAFDRAIYETDEEKLEKLNSVFDEFEEQMLSQITSPKSFYDSLVIVPYIAINSIKAVYMLDTNKHANEAKSKRVLNLIVEKGENKTEDISCQEK